MASGRQSTYSLKSQLKRFSWLSICTWGITLIFALPLLVIFSSVLNIETEIWLHLSETVLSTYLTNSLILAVCVGLGCAFIGTYLAWFMVHYQFLGKRILNWLLLLPLAMPAYIIAYTYTGLLDFAGPVQMSLRQLTSAENNQAMLPDIRSLPGAIAMMILVLYPYVYLLARTAFSEQSQQLMLVSKLSGLTQMQHIVRVALPLARPAILTGAALAMMEALADYGTVAYFGVSTFTTGIYRTWFGIGNAAAASQLASLLCLFVFILLLLEKYSRKNASRFQTSQPKPIQVKQLSSGKSLLVCVLCFIPAILGFLVPFLQLSWWSVRYFEQQTLVDYVPLLTMSLKLAFISALVIVGLALLISYCKRVVKSKKINLASQFISLGYALPGVVVAVGVIQVAGFSDIKLNQLTHFALEIQPGLVFSGTIFVLIFAYAVRYLSVALHNTDAGLERIKPNIDEVAASLGASKSQTLFKLHIPMLRASIISAFILVFVDVLKELPATLILRPFNVNTLAVKAFELASDERLIDAALPAISIVLAGIIPVILLTRNLQKQHKQTLEKQ